MRRLHVFPKSKLQVQSGFKLMIMKKISPSCHLIRHLTPFRLWELNMLAVGLTNI